MKEIEAKCKECTYYYTEPETKIKTIGQTDMGFCRRYPPKTMALPGQVTGTINMHTMFPGVSPNAWCGEYNVSC